jgi:hypothetical protein
MVGDVMPLYKPCGTVAEKWLALEQPVTNNNDLQPLYTAGHYHFTAHALSHVIPTPADRTDRRVHLHNTTKAR